LNALNNNKNKDLELQQNRLGKYLYKKVRIMARSLFSSVEALQDTFKVFTTETGKMTAVGVIMRKKLAAQIVGMEALNDATVLLNRGISSQIGFNKKLIDSYVEAAAESMVFENRNKELNKTFGISSAAAAKVSQTIHKLAKTHGFGGEQAIEYAASIKKMLPTFDQQSSAGAKTAESLQRIQHVLTTNLGLTDEATAKYSLYASKNGENADITLQFASSLGKYLKDDSGTMGYMKMAIQGIAEAGEDTQLQFGKIPGNLELATIKAKSLGFELDDLAQTGKNLLNIESSIGDELEYQLLSGHRLVDAGGKSLTNAYREATLRGNMSDAASTLNTILENEGTVLENNLFAREKMAKLMGMDEATLSRALQKKKLLSSDAGLSVLMNLDGTELQETAKGMLANNKMTQKQFDELSKLNDTRTTDDIMRQQLIVAEESKEVLTNMLTKTQATQMAAAKAALTSKSSIDNFSNDVMSNLKTEQLTTLGQTENIAKRNEMAVAAYAQMGAGQLAPNNAGIAVPVKDAVIPSGYGDRILTFPKDTLQPNIAFNDKDNIMATTYPPTFDQPTYGGDMGQSSGNNSSAEYLSLAKALAENNSSATPGASTDAGIMAMGLMIVAAINSAKGSNLFGKTSMNDSLYP